MRVIISGSRVLEDVRIIERAVQLSGFEVTSLLSAHNSGIESVAELWAKRQKIKIERFPLDFTKPNAGFIRNERMAIWADAIVLIWTGSGPSAHLLECAKFYECQIFEARIKHEPGKV
jgi:hypothetical protein